MHYGIGLRESSGRGNLLPTTREGNVFTGVCLSTFSLIDTGSLLGLLTGSFCSF